MKFCRYNILMYFKTYLNFIQNTFLCLFEKKFIMDIKSIFMDHVLKIGFYNEKFVKSNYFGNDILSKLSKG